MVGRMESVNEMIARTLNLEAELGNLPNEKPFKKNGSFLSACRHTGAFGTNTEAMATSRLLGLFLSMKGEVR